MAQLDPAVRLASWRARGTLRSSIRVSGLVTWGETLFLTSATSPAPCEALHPSKTTLIPRTFLLRYHREPSNKKNESRSYLKWVRNFTFAGSHILHSIFYFWRNSKRMVSLSSLGSDPLKVIWSWSYILSSLFPPWFFNHGLPLLGNVSLLCGKVSPIAVWVFSTLSTSWGVRWKRGQS